MIRDRRMYAFLSTHYGKLGEDNRRLRDALTEARYYIELAAYRDDSRFIGCAYDAITKALQ